MGFWTWSDYRNLVFTFRLFSISKMYQLYLSAWMCRLRISLASPHEDFVTAWQHTAHTYMLFMQTRNLCCWQLKLACNAIIYFSAGIGIYENRKCQESNHNAKMGKNQNHAFSVVLKMFSNNKWFKRWYWWLSLPANANQFAFLFLFIWMQWNYVFEAVLHIDFNVAEDKVARSNE